MTQDTFIKTVRAVTDPKGVHLSGSQESKLHALARQYSAGQTDVAEAVETLKSIFADASALGRHEYADIEKRLERY